MMLTHRNFKLSMKCIFAFFVHLMTYHREISTPVGSLLHLRELTLRDCPTVRIDISPLEKTLVNLEKLTILQFVIGDLFALRGHDISPLSGFDRLASRRPVSVERGRTLAEVSIDQRSVPGLSALTSSTLTTLHIQNSYARADSVDLTPLRGCDI